MCLLPVNPPVEPNRDGGHNESIAIEQSTRLGRVILTETLQQQLLLTGHFTRLGWHFV